MHLTREHKVLIASFAAGIVGGILLSRVRMSATMDGLAKAAILGVQTGQRMGASNPEDYVKAAMHGVLSQWGGRRSSG